MASPLFKVFKGLSYGAVIGIFFGLCIYVLGSAVAGMGFLTVDPRVLAGLVFSSGIMAGVAKEYSDWLEENSTKKE